MRDSKHTATVYDPVSDARRYVQNAKDILRDKAILNPETQYYSDKKYVRMAGNTLWNGVLLILDAVFHVRKDKRTRPDISDYQRVISQRDQKLLDHVNVGYEVMHLSMGYDGILKKSICNDGIQIANIIIDRCEKMLVN